MATDTPYKGGSTVEAGPWPGSGGGGGGTSGMEARIAKLETDIEYVKRDVGELRSDMRDVRDRVIGIEQNMATKGFVFGAYIAVSGLLAAATVFQEQIRHLLGVSGTQ